MISTRSHHNRDTAISMASKGVIHYWLLLALLAQLIWSADSVLLPVQSHMPVVDTLPLASAFKHMPKGTGPLRNACARIVGYHEQHTVHSLHPAAVHWHVYVSKVLDHSKSPRIRLQHLEKLACVCMWHPLLGEFCVLCDLNMHMMNLHLHHACVLHNVCS